jgi:hypothetical protein
MRVVAHGMTEKAIVVGGEADVGRFFTFGMKASPTVTTFAIGVVARDTRVPLDLVVAQRTFAGTFPLGSFYDGGAVCTEGLPFQRCTGGNEENDSEENAGSARRKENKSLRELHPATTTSSSTARPAR